MSETATLRLSVPRVVIAGLSGDSGKTLVTLGLARAARDRGRIVHGAKKGPDFIDAAWLQAATGRPCATLDTFMMSRAGIGSALAPSADAELLLIEGNRGLYDGVDGAGSHSTAALAKQLHAPVVLVVDAHKVTATVGALVLGCRTADPDLEIAGVILNRVATGRHEAVIRDAVARTAGVPVLGALPRLPDGGPLPGRHLGLVTAAEHPAREAALDTAAALLAEHVDLAALDAIAARAPAIDLPTLAPATEPGPPVRIGFLVDEAFTFYYPDNLNRLRACGATVLPVPSHSPGALADLDALVIGGGFPEAHAQSLAENLTLKSALKAGAARGLPIYAECGGLMLLARELLVDGVSYPMAGVLDLAVEQTSRPQGHGYEIAVVDRPNWLFREGTELIGHEFHYSKVTAGSALADTALQVSRGHGIAGRDGIVQGSVWASYLHLHALATPTWATGLVAAARRYAALRLTAQATWA